MEFKTGLALEIGIQVIDDEMASITLEPQLGVYTDVYAAATIMDLKQVKTGWYVEFGAYVSADISGDLFFLDDTVELKHQFAEIKIPFIEEGAKEFPLGISANVNTVRALNNKVSIPAVYMENFDISDSTIAMEEIDAAKLKFNMQNGTRLQVEKGKIILPANLSDGTGYIKVSYIDPDSSEVYEDLFKVVVSGSVLEGNVSSYTAVGTAPLKNAKVQITGTIDNTEFDSVVWTGDDGKFSVNLPEGEYTLKISADGYRELVTTQRVEKDEIKYTEHIMLMEHEYGGGGRGEVGENTGTAYGKVTDALNGKGIEGMEIKIRENWNNTSGPYVEEFKTVTDANGKYTIDGVPIGYYTVEASKNQYVSDYTNIMVMNKNERTDYEFSVTPKVEPGQIRITLSWGGKAA